MVTAVTTAVAALVIGLSGCSGDQAPTLAVDPAPVAATGRPPAVPGPDDPRSPTEPASADDTTLARAFTAYAVEPRAGTAAGVPFAPRVWVGLGENLFTSVGGRAAGDPSSWPLDLDAFGRTGPMDVLRVLRQHVRRHGTEGLRVTVGSHPRCTGRAAAAPRSMRLDRRIVIRPAAPTVRSCLDWFAVDLYVDDTGRVRGVTLDLWEP